MDHRIILTGVTGNTGQVIAQELTRRGIPFTAMVRSEASRSKLAALGIQTIAGDFDDPLSLLRALEGFEKAYLVCTPDEKLIPRETSFIEAAKKAGVRHIVYCSAYMACLDGASQNLRSHGVVEQTLVSSGLDYTILRPHGFMQTFTGFSWDMVKKAGVLSMPGGDGALPLVDLGDVALVAVKALTEPGHAGKAYDLTGPEALDPYQIAETIQQAIKRPVTYIPGDEKQFVFILKLMGVPETPREHVIKIFSLQREHKLEKVHSTLQELGIQPTTYEQFIQHLVAGQTGEGHSFEPPDSLIFKIMNAIMPLMARLNLFFYQRSHPVVPAGNS